MARKILTSKLFSDVQQIPNYMFCLNCSIRNVQAYVFETKDHKVIPLNLVVLLSLVIVSSQNLCTHVRKTHTRTHKQKRNIYIYKPLPLS